VLVGERLAEALRRRCDRAAQQQCQLLDERLPEDAPLRATFALSVTATLPLLYLLPPPLIALPVSKWRPLWRRVSLARQEQSQDDPDNP